MGPAPNLASYQQAATSIPLNGGKFALVDIEDLPKLGKWKWHFHHTGYVVRNRYLGFIDGKHKFKHERLHRVIMGNPKDKMVDHVNGDKLDNRKSNLRVTDNAHNKANGRLYRTNKTGYKGVHQAISGRYFAVISKGGNDGNIHLGTFDTAREAAKAYNKAAAKKWGEFARLNEVNYGS